MRPPAFSAPTAALAVILGRRQSLALGQHLSTLGFIFRCGAWGLGSSVIPARAIGLQSGLVHTRKAASMCGVVIHQKYYELAATVRSGRTAHWRRVPSTKKGTARSAQVAYLYLFLF